MIEQKCERMEDWKKKRDGQEKKIKHTKFILFNIKAIVTLTNHLIFVVFLMVIRFYNLNQQTAI